MQTLVRPTAHPPPECKAHTGVICEHCLTPLVISKNPIANLFADLVYVVGNFFSSFIVALALLVCSPGRLLTAAWRAIVSVLGTTKKKKHTHRADQQICEQCIASMASSGFEFSDEVRENILLVFRAIAYLGELIAIYIVGLFMIICMFCPSLTRTKSKYEQERDNQDASKRDAEFAATKKELQSWSDEQERHFKKQQDDYNKYLDEEDQIHRNNTLVFKINNALPENELLDTGNDVMVDDQLVSKLNATVKAVDDGKEDASAVHKIAEELLESRREKANKDARRHELHSQARDKEWSAKQLYKDADAKARDGKYREADELAAKADSAMRDANGLYQQYSSV